MFAATITLLLLAAQDDAAFQRMRQSQRQVTAYLERAAAAVTAQAASEISSRETWEKARLARLAEMRDMLGLDPPRERTPLNVRVTGTLDKGDYTIEKVAFESLPKIYVTANLYVPKRRSGRLPAIVYVCGHAISPHGDKTQYQRHGISFAKNGYVALVLDSIQIAETFALHHGVGWQEMYDWYARGYTPAGVEVWNAMRAIDYLESRPEVDPERIGMTGRSGGAAMSWFTATVDPRVKAVAPVMGISTYAANVRDNTQRLHCDCMFVVNNYRHDMLHQGALIAPRPLLMMHGRKDALFPVAGYEEFERRVGGLYAGYGTEFGNVVVDSGHQDSDYLREQAIRFFDRHLLKVTDRRLDMDYSNAPAESLAVFSGSPPADAANFRVHETFLPTPELPPAITPLAWTQRRSQTMTRLRERTFAAFPAQPPPLAPRVTGKADGFEDLDFTSEEGITVRALIRRPQAPSPKRAAVLYVASDGDDPRAVTALMSTLNRRNTAVRMAVYPRGVGEIGWEKSFWIATLRNAMHTGRTIDSMRLWDVLRALELLRAQPDVDPARITVLGKGAAAGLALYAALLDDRILQAVLMDPPLSHRQGPIFLNVLRYLDLPEAAAMIAPRRVIFYAHVPPAYEAARRIYAALGVPDRMVLSMNIDAVVEGRYDHNFGSGF
ncbi:MAG: alpha/beta hydrolase [Bryobacteraceae bacterium]